MKRKIFINLLFVSVGCVLLFAFLLVLLQTRIPVFTMAVAGLCALAACAAISLLVSRKLTKEFLRPLEQIREVLEKEDIRTPSITGLPQYRELVPVSQSISKLVRRLDHQIAELKKAERVRMDFTANVSHELKTPLTSIKGFTDMLESGMVEDEQTRRKFITMISVEVDRLIFLINDILKLSELEEFAILQPEERTEIYAAAKQAVEMLRPTAEKNKISISLRGEEAYAHVESERLKELLINLIDNAIKYNEPGGSVAVVIQKYDRELGVTVQDTGIGIPEEHQSRVFERFYRVDKGRSKKKGGTGLGLAIVKHIVQLYGGRLELKSRPGQGTAVTAFFPVG